MRKRSFIYTKRHRKHRFKPVFGQLRFNPDNPSEIQIRKHYTWAKFKKEEYNER